VKLQKIVSFFLFVFLFLVSFFVQASDDWMKGLTSQQIQMILGGDEMVSPEEAAFGEKKFDPDIEVFVGEQMKESEIPEGIEPEVWEQIKDRPDIWEGEGPFKEKPKKPWGPAEGEDEIDWLTRVLKKQKEEQERERKRKKYPKKKFSVGKEKIFAKEAKMNGVKIYQPNVFNQFEDPKGAADCGYHLLKNARLIVKADVEKLGGRPLEEQLLKKKPKPSWKNFVKKYRLEKKLARYLKNLFEAARVPSASVPDLPKYSPFKKKELSDLYKSILDKLATEVAREVVQNRKSFLFIGSGLDWLQNLIEDRQMMPVEIRKYYKSTIKEEDKTLGRLRNYAFDENVMRRFIDFNKLNKLAINPEKLDLFFVQNKQFSGEEQMKAAGLTEPASGGEWADGGDIPRLWKSHKDFEFPGVEFFAYDEVDTFGTGFDSNKLALEKAAERIAKGEKLRVVFGIGTMTRRTDPRGPIGGKKGHWFALVRLSNGFYVVMDSALNINRLDHTNVKKIVTEFEKLIKKAKRQRPKR